jgi:hypothetical protein
MFMKVMMRIKTRIRMYPLQHETLVRNSWVLVSEQSVISMSSPNYTTSFLFSRKEKGIFVYNLWYILWWNLWSPVLIRLSYCRHRHFYQVIPHRLCPWPLNLSFHFPVTPGCLYYSICGVLVDCSAVKCASLVASIVTELLNS